MPEILWQQQESDHRGKILALVSVLWKLKSAEINQEKIVNFQQCKQQAFVPSVSPFVYSVLSVLIMNFFSNTSSVSPLGIIPESIRNC